MALYGGAPNYIKWVHGIGENFLLVDGHVRWSPLEGNSSYDPFHSGDNSGNVLVNGSYSPYYDGCHKYLFRPDYVP